MAHDIHNAKICCFLGHSNTPPEIYPALIDAIERHITEHNARIFLASQYGLFNSMALHAVQKVKSRHPNIASYLVLAYRPTPGWKSPLQAFVDNTIFQESLETVPPEKAIPEMTRRMVQNSDCLIAYVTHAWDDTATTFQYACGREQNGELTICNLGTFP